VIRRTRTLGLVAVGTALALGAATALALAPRAEAAPADPDAGWMRVAHLSPDTAAVDIEVRPASGARVDLPDIGFGEVSDYLPLSPGEYGITLVPAGGGPELLEQDVVVAGGIATTVTVSGLRADLAVGHVDDTPSAPATGTWRLRLMNATASDGLDAVSTTGASLAAGLRAGGFGDYADLTAGDTSFAVTTRSRTTELPLSPAEGTSATVFLVNTPDGGIAAVTALDAAAGPTGTTGGIDTGGGWAARTGGIDTRTGGGTADQAAGSGTTPSGAAETDSSGTGAGRDTLAPHTTAGAGPLLVGGAPRFLP
jgi:hypothetical protein